MVYIVFLILEMKKDLILNAKKSYMLFKFIKQFYKKGGDF